MAIVLNRKQPFSLINISSKLNTFSKGFGVYAHHMRLFNLVHTKIILHEHFFDENLLDENKADCSSN